jgi:anti-sigma factor RsiW
MTCRDWEERIALHAGGDLPAPEAAELETHLAACEGCRGAAEVYRAGLELLREAHREPVAEAHYAAVRARVLAELRRPRRPVWRRMWVCGLVATAAVAVLLLLPRPAHTPERIEIAAIRPVGPQTEELAPAAPAGLAHPRRAAASLATRARKAPVGAAVSEPEKRSAEPLVVKLLTDDPNVVIYWIAD